MDLARLTFSSLGLLTGAMAWREKSSVNSSILSNGVSSISVQISLVAGGAVGGASAPFAAGGSSGELPLFSVLSVELATDGGRGAGGALVTIRVQYNGRIGFGGLTALLRMARKILVIIRL